MGREISTVQEWNRDSWTKPRIYNSTDWPRETSAWTKLNTRFHKMKTPKQNPNLMHKNVSDNLKWINQCNVEDRFNKTDDEEVRSIIRNSIRRFSPKNKSSHTAIFWRSQRSVPRGHYIGLQRALRIFPDLDTGLFHGPTWSLDLAVWHEY